MSEPLDRRTFTHTLLTASALAATGRTEASAAGADKEEQKPEEKPPKIPAEALYLQLVLQTYPHAKLDDDALDEVRSDIEQQLRRSRALSKFPLANGDDPAGGFHAFRARDK